MSLTVHYPLDLTGKLQSNYTEFPVTVEGGTENRAFAYPGGAFFTDDFVLRDADNLTIPLVRGLDYELPYTIPELIKLSGGKEIATTVVVKPHVGSDLRVAAQVVGGPYGLDASAINQAIADLDLTDQPLEYYHLLNLPETFRAAPHYKDIGNVFGFEYIVSILTQTLNTISVGTRGDIDALVVQLGTYTDALLEAFNAHISAEGNVHGLTIDLIDGLSRAEIMSLLDDITLEYEVVLDVIGNTNDEFRNLSHLFKNLTDAFEVIDTRYAQLEGRLSNHDVELGLLNEQLARSIVGLSKTDNTVAEHEELLTFLNEAVTRIMRGGGAGGSTMNEATKLANTHIILGNNVRYLPIKKDIYISPAKLAKASMALSAPIVGTPDVVVKYAAGNIVDVPLLTFPIITDERLAPASLSVGEYLFGIDLDASTYPSGKYFYVSATDGVGWTPATQVRQYPFDTNDYNHRVSTSYAISFNGNLNIPTTTLTAQTLFVRDSKMAVLENTVVPEQVTGSCKLSLSSPVLSEDSGTIPPGTVIESFTTVDVLQVDGSTDDVVIGTLAVPLASPIVSHTVGARGGVLLSAQAEFPKMAAGYYSSLKFKAISLRVYYRVVGSATWAVTSLETTSLGQLPSGNANTPTTVLDVSAVEIKPYQVKILPVSPVGTALRNTVLSVFKGADPRSTVSVEGTVTYDWINDNFTTKGSAKATVVRGNADAKSKVRFYPSLKVGDYATGTTGVRVWESDTVGTTGYLYESISIDKAVSIDIGVLTKAAALTTIPTTNTTAAVIPSRNIAGQLDAAFTTTGVTLKAGDLLSVYGGREVGAANNWFEVLLPAGEDDSDDELTYENTIFIGSTSFEADFETHVSHIDLTQEP